MLDRIYLDHAATTPVRPEVRDAMLPYLGEAAFGNPSSGHHYGRAARAGLEQARAQVAAALGVQPREVVFTSGGTEADNMAVLGAALLQLHANGKGPSPIHLVSSPTEHKAVLAALKEAKHFGAKVTFLPVDSGGVVDLAALDEVLAGQLPAGRPTLVSIMWVNNETGTVQPIAAIAERCAAAGVPLHTDAVQAFGKVPVRLTDLPVASATLSAHKIGGPKGVGVLFVRDRQGVKGLVHGGGQQGGLRPGTENVAGAVGFGVAAELAAAEQLEWSAAIQAMRDALQAAIVERVPDVVVHGAGAPRGPNILNLSAPDTDSEAMLMHLDLAGIACASGSACTTGSVEPSHVLTAMGVPRELAIGAVRMSLGALSRPEQIPRIAETFAGCVQKVRKLRAVLARP
jgi:cysteine desulfurase